MSKKLGMFMSALLFIILVGCASNGASYDVKDDAKTYPEAVELFQKNQCLLCHGTDLKGRMGEPSNLTAIGSIRTVEQIFEVIRDGKDIMPAFHDKMTDDEIRQLSQWLFTKKGNEVN